MNSTTQDALQNRSRTFEETAYELVMRICPTVDSRTHCCEVMVGGSGYERLDAELCGRSTDWICRNCEAEVCAKHVKEHVC